MTLCCKYNSGMFREPITFQRATKTSDGAGGYTESWATLLSTFAVIEKFSGSETFASERIEARTKYRIVCHYFSGLRPTDRVVMRSTNYDITATENIEFKDQYLAIDLEGGVPT